MGIIDASGLGLSDLLAKEWLAVNQIGGYACTSVAGMNTRKYHGLLVAAMAPPVRRMVLLSRVEETVIVSRSERYSLSSSEYPGTIHPDGYKHLRAFSSDPFPRWVYQAEGFTVEKTLRLVPGQNTVCLEYTLLAGSNHPVKLEMRPLFALRGIHELSYQWNGQLEAQKRSTQQYRIPPTNRTPEVFFAHDGEYLAPPGGGYWYKSTIYRQECERGYAGLEDLWMPGTVTWSLTPGQSVHFICSTEPIDQEKVLDNLNQQAIRNIASDVADPAIDPAVGELLRAADAFVTTSPKQAFGAITQYPWSAPSARDALIGFAGLFLIPRRFAEARVVLGSLADRMQDGIIPSEFPEDGSVPTYGGADTSLWFINAVHDLARYSGDRAMIQDQFFETVIRIIRSYQAGTALGIQLDAEGLLQSHMPGAGTTWMDAKVGEWVITPRQGRPVELNALWYNALQIAAEFCRQFNHGSWASEFHRLAESVRVSFNRRFWNEMAGCCFDVVSDRGTDSSVRPNQLLAFSLPYQVLSADRHQMVLEKVTDHLLTPFGLRTLATSDPAYQGRYCGDAVSRDRAYHQGSAYPWLFQPYIASMLRLAGRSPESISHARQLLEPVIQHLTGDGLGQLCELFDGSSPHRPGGALACARSVGCVLQAYVEAAEDPSIKTPLNLTAAIEIRPPVGA